MASRVRPTYAHFPGGGPAGRTCRQCRYAFDNPAAGTPEERLPRCYRLRDLIGTALEDLAPVPLSSPACKYFAEETR